MLARFVIDQFEDILAAVVATAIFILVIGVRPSRRSRSIITTIKDMTGLAIYFASVSLLVPRVVLGE